MSEPLRPECVARLRARGWNIRTEAERAEVLRLTEEMAALVESKAAEHPAAESLQRHAAAAIAECRREAQALRESA